MTDQTPEGKTSRKLEEKQQRRLAEERRAAEARSAKRKRSLVTLGLALLIGALVVFLILSERKASEFTGGEDPQAAGCSDVEEYPLAAEAVHVDEGTDVQYTSVPPTSGDHYEAPSSAAFFAAPVEEERLVHNLEHGQIVIWYSTDAPDDVVEDIEGYVQGTQDGAILAAPYEGLEDGEFAMSAWGAAQSCEKVSAEVIDAFRVKYQGKGPERIAPLYEAPEGNS